MQPTSGKHGAAQIVVVGSLNADIVVRVERHPRPGETVLGGDRFDNPGGKGANQAVAASRLGRRVAMIGRVGDDPAGTQLRQALHDARVDDVGVTVDGGAATGTAFITVSDEGENSIVVAQGANGRVDASDIEPHRDLLQQATICLLQLEIGDQAVTAAAQAAGGTVVLNPAPARTLPEELLQAVDVLVPNQSELAVLAGSDDVPDDHDAVATMAGRLPVDRIVVTMGGQGAMVIDRGTVTHVPAPVVDPVDTTAAGDAFCGALADALVDDTNLVDAARWAVVAGACAVRQDGAQRSLPARADVEALADAT